MERATNIAGHRNRTYVDCKKRQRNKYGSACTFLFKPVGWRLSFSTFFKPKNVKRASARLTFFTLLLSPRVMLNSLLLIIPPDCYSVLVWASSNVCAEMSPLVVAFIATCSVGLNLVIYHCLQLLVTACVLECTCNARVRLEARATTFALSFGAHCVRSSAYRKSHMTISFSTRALSKN